MLLKDFLKALQEIKQQNRHYDFHEFELLIDGQQIVHIQSGEGFSLNLLSSQPVETEGDKDVDV